MPILLLLALFITVPLAELYLIIQVGGEIGVLPTILILLADSILGSMLLRAQARAAWRRFNEATAAGRVPHREALDGVLVAVGGALLLTPGFITDVVGLLLLIPPTRAIFRRLVVRVITRRVATAASGMAAAERGAPRPRRAYDVEGTATEAGTTDGTPGDLTAPRLER